MKKRVAIKNIFSTMKETYKSVLLLNQQMHIGKILIIIVKLLEII